MTGTFLGRLGHVLIDIFVLFAVASAFVNLFQAIKCDPKDRVLLFEVLALASFVLAVEGGVLVHRFHWPFVPFVLLLPVPFVIFMTLAGYFALTNWLRRKRKPA